MTSAVEPKVAGRRRFLMFATFGLLLCVTVRLIHYNQSLWCDEMSVLTSYAYAPWHKIVAPGAGEYTPNNHFLQTILTRLILQVSRTPLRASRVAVLIRLPALIAGVLMPLALAWPFWHRSRLLALLLLLFAATNPFLVEYSDEARGYALMTLLGVVATHLLPNGAMRWPIIYGVVIAAMIYTVPVSGMLVISHGVTIFMLRKSAGASWLRGMVIAGGISIFFFLPMARGLWFYSQHPLVTPDSFVDFINQLPRMIFMGQHLPGDALAEVVSWIAPVLLLIVGTFFAWRQMVLRVPIMVMGLATVAFIIVTFFIPSVGQVRFVPWCAVWLVMAMTAIVIELLQKRKAIAIVVVFLFAGWFVFRDIILLPSQPIRDAIVQADAIAPNRTNILVGFLGAEDVVDLYGGVATAHRLTATPGPMAFLEIEQKARASTGQSPWLILSFESMVQRTTPEFWNYIQGNYELKTRLPGRISPVGIYQPRLSQ